jgi:hypothetical protein
LESKHVSWQSLYETDGQGFLIMNNLRFSWLSMVLCWNYVWPWKDSHADKFFLEKKACGMPVAPST